MPRVHALLPTIALFRDATELLFALAEGRRAGEPDAPPVPPRHFVADADEAHRIALEGPAPIVGMSLDDLMDCARMAHPAAGELRAFAAVHRGFLTLMAAPGITRLSDLKGRRVAVDTDTGYASALFEILAREGLARGRDYDVVYAGATNLRFQKLVDGAFDATLLGAPFTRLAAARGFVPLCSVIDALGGYQAIVLVAHRSWLAAHGAQARAVAESLSVTLAWARDPANQRRRDALLGDLLPGCPAPVRAAVAEDLFGPGSDFLCTPRPTAEDVTVVLDLFNAGRGTALGPADVDALWADLP